MAEEKNIHTEQEPVGGDEGVGTGDQESSSEKQFSQEDLDNTLSKRLGKQKEKLSKEFDKKLKETVAEMEKRAKLSEEELERELANQKEQESKEREDKVTIRENRLDVIDALIDMDIPNPKGIAEFLVDLDGDKQDDNIQAFHSAFTDAVESAVAKRLAGEAPDDIDSSDSDDETGAPLQRFI